MFAKENNKDHLRLIDETNRRLDEVLPRAPKDLDNKAQVEQGDGQNKRPPGALIMKKLSTRELVGGIAILLAVAGLLTWGIVHWFSWFWAISVLVLIGMLLFLYMAFTASGWALAALLVVWGLFVLWGWWPRHLLSLASVSVETPRCTPPDGEHHCLFDMTKGVVTNGDTYKRYASSPTTRIIHCVRDSLSVSAKNARTTCLPLLLSTEIDPTTP